LRQKAKSKSRQGNIIRPANNDAERAPKPAVA
jgi:hypothetical protein